MSIEQDTQEVRINSLGWMIQRIAGQLGRAMEKRLGDHGLSQQHFAVLMTVLETDGLSQTQIGERFKMPPYATSRAIDHLEKMQLLERRPHSTSRRTHTIHVTDQGRELGPVLFSIVREVNEELAKRLSGDQRTEFKKLLEIVL